MLVPARHYAQRWPAITPRGRYLGQYTTVTPTATATGASSGTGAQLSVEQIISQVNPGHSSPDDTTMSEAITGLQLTPGYNVPSECSKATDPSKAPTIETAIGSSTMGVGTKLLAANPIIGGVVMAAGGILDLIGAITAHHAKAVQNEQTILCQAVPATNAALAQVMQDVQSGTYSAAQGAAYLQQILSAFTSAVAPITKSCNESCGLTKELNGIVIAMTQQLSSISVSSGGAAISAPGGLLSGIPTWALLAGGALLLFSVLSRD